MQVNRHSSVVSFLQLFKEAPGLFLSKLDVISTAGYSPTTLWQQWFFLEALASGYVVASALKDGFVSDAGRADGMDKRCLWSGCKKNDEPGIELQSYNHNGVLHDTMR